MQSAANAPIQLRKSVHIGSLMDIVYLDLLQNYCLPNTELVVEWNALGKFREKDDTLSRDNMKKLFNHLTGIINANLGEETKAWHFLDDHPKTLEITEQLVQELLKRDLAYFHEYQAHFCEQCNSYLAPKQFEIERCKNCGSKPITKTAFDIFVKSDKNLMLEHLSLARFEPAYTRHKFMETFKIMPNAYAITKTRNFGFSAENFHPKLVGKKFDPKFVASLFPIILERLDRPPLASLVIGEDILGRYLYYLFANGCLFNMRPLNIYVHGLLSDQGKKISKYNHLPISVDISNFLGKWSWDHLRLLCLSSKFGKNIDFQKKLVDVTKLIIKRHNVLMFLNSVSPKYRLAEKTHELENLIIKHCSDLLKLLSEFEWFEFYKGYRALWFELLSRQYISSIKNGEASKNGINMILKAIKRLP